MLAGVSHDLRTPLTRLRLSIEMLAGKIDAPTQSGMVEDIEDMDAIIGQFLAFARGIDSEQPERVDLNQLVDATCTRYARSGKPITCELSTFPALILRPLAMQRLLSNLLDNAFNHGSAELRLIDHAVKQKLLSSQRLVKIQEKRSRVDHWEYYLEQNRQEGATWGELIRRKGIQINLPDEFMCEPARLHTRLDSI